MYNIISKDKDKFKDLDYLGNSHRVLGLIDDSTIEKPESWFSEGLGAVYSSKSARLTKIKRGYYHKGNRFCVPGYDWSAMMISGLIKA